MIIPELKDKYQVTGIYQGLYLDMRYLFSGRSDKDPEYCVQDAAASIKHWDVVFAIGPAGIVITQTIEFKTKEGRDKYIRDGIIIFDYTK